MKEPQHQQNQQLQDPQYIAMPQNMQPRLHRQDDGIDLKELWTALWAGKWLIIAITIIFAAASVAYAIYQPNIYKASTVLAPAGDSGSGGLSKLAGQFGGLASLAGISLGGGSADQTGIALEVLKSRVFTEQFIERHQLLVPLMAAKNWDQISNELQYKPDVYDVSTKEWVRKASFPKTSKPSSWEAFERFRELVTVSQIKETGMVIISIEYYSPIIAKQWLTYLVQDLNEQMRTKDQQEAKNSIDFLNEKLENNLLASDMQSIFYQLIEEQTKTMMLTEVSKEYVFKTIDPPNAPEDKEKPKRAIISIFGTILGGMFALLFVLVRHYAFKPEKEIE
ncbi:Wzz/FepE/Etk N-terminal domain-containing protein [Thalassotalea sp. ND16A]|uniref:Wzz/FepE/Etk N-terminal domain-containing protein n=1 Tax=Thalassotalea sp. ND16A TaxID=1535422 RepID=UPI00051A421D|nr:Wzz/FepE/Etk N-terminal domain-containing protein [Thalassotalea sp. ND16A]KGJ90188.1 hypothetical protein ND16A_2038 [Thalassotalea sp. ND16A]